MGKVIENVFFLTAVTAAVAFTRWCIREMRQAPVHKVYTPEELQEIWEQQQQEKYEKELEWEAENG